MQALPRTTGARSGSTKWMPNRRQAARSEKRASWSAWAFCWQRTCLLRLFISFFCQNFQRS